MKTESISIKIDTSQIDNLIEKLTMLSEKMQEAKSLADEVASCTRNIRLEIEV